jgi:hypothetical protein
VVVASRHIVLSRVSAAASLAGRCRRPSRTGWPLAYGLQLACRCFASRALPLRSRVATVRWSAFGPTAFAERRRADRARR